MVLRPAVAPIFAALVTLVCLAPSSTSAPFPALRVTGIEEGTPAAGEASTTTASLGVVVELTDDNFDQLVSSDPTWMVEVYAPWCSHCRQLEPVWKQLAQELAPLGIRTGKIDGPKNKVLMTRFGISSFPAIFLLKDGGTWEYDGARTTQALKEFALSGHEKATAMPFWKAPNGALGRLLGQWHRLPSMVREAYTFLHEVKGWSDLAIVVTFLTVPVLVGALSICFIDGVYLRQARLTGDLGHEHAE